VAVLIAVDDSLCSLFLDDMVQYSMDLHKSKMKNNRTEIQQKVADIPQKKHMNPSNDPLSGMINLKYNGDSP
jgi:hypothetical protein